MAKKKEDKSLKPIAFMVMPFRERKVPSPPKGAPAVINCDALWDRAFKPALKKLGYLPIRADIEVGSVIVKDMLERLAFAKLVLADMTLPNGNVYYEVGLRHVAKKTHCVLIAADWSKQLFDVDQIRTDRYPLKDGSVPKEEAKVIRKMLRELIPKKKDSPTPFYEYVTSKEESTVFREQIEKINEFQTDVRAIRKIKDKDKRKKKVNKLHDQYKLTSLHLPEVALELLTLIRDSLGWNELLAYAKTLPADLQQRPFTKEQVFLAQSELGDHHEAIEGLKKLIELQGDSPERQGLIGGRYKRLWREARDKRNDEGIKDPDLEELGYLKSAIEHYTLGMKLDYNEYYCASNLPGLIREQGDDNSEQEAIFLDNLIVRICERKLDRAEDDGWVKPTLLGAAFRAQDVTRVEELAIEVATQGAAVWELKSTLGDINDAVERIKDNKTKKKLSNIRDQLAKLIQEP